jgi:hypothetical protein
MYLQIPCKISLRVFKCNYVKTGYMLGYIYKILEFKSGVAYYICSLLGPKSFSPRIIYQYGEKHIQPNFKHA